MKAGRRMESTGSRKLEDSPTSQLDGFQRGANPANLQIHTQKRYRVAIAGYLKVYLHVRSNRLCMQDNTIFSFD